MPSQEDAALQECREHVRKKLESLAPLFARASIGDFSLDVDIPKKEDEFTELFVGTQLMIDVIREKIATLEKALRDLATNNAELEHSKALDEAILGSIGEGIIAVDNDYQITYINATATKMLGWSEKEAIGRSYFEVVSLVDSGGKKVSGLPQPALEGSDTPGDTSTLLKVKGVEAPLPVSLLVNTITLGSETIGAVSVIRDITDELALARAKNEIISIASHQLRTPITTIKWYTETILAGARVAFTPKIKSYIKTIHESNQRMIELVDGLLNVSRLDMGTMRYRPEPLIIQSVVQSVLRDLRPIIIKRGIKVNISYEDNMPVIISDAQTTHLIIQTLLSNAVRYSPTKGGEVHLSITRKHASTIIAVKDNGCGIPTEEQPKIFTKLFRANNARTVFTDGTGLGLYVVKTILERYGGKIWFKSKENHGSTFYVMLPIASDVPNSPTITAKEGTK